MYWLTLYDGPNDKEGTVIHNPFPKGAKTSAAKGRLVVSGISNMSFTINQFNPMWGRIKPMRTLIKVTYETKNSEELIFSGRVLNLKQSMATSGIHAETYECEDVLAYLYDSIQSYDKVQNASVTSFLKMILDQHNSQVEPHKRFKLGRVTVSDPNDSLYRFLGYEKTYDAIKEKLVNTLGGYLVVRYENDGMYLDYLSSVGVKSDTAIRLRDNLKSMDKSITPQKIITKLVPLGAKLEGRAGVVDSFEYLDNGKRVARVEIEGENDLLDIPESFLPSGTDVGSYLNVYGNSPNWVITASSGETGEDSAQPRLTIESVNDGVDYLINDSLVSEFGIVQDKIEYDDITTAAALISRGRKDLNSQTLQASYSVVSADYSLIDGNYDELKAGNWHELDNSVLAIEEPIQITELAVDFIDPRNPDLTLGDKKVKLTQYQKEANKRVDNIKKLQTALDQQTKSIVRLEKSNKEVSEKYNKIQVAYDNLNTNLEIDAATGTSMALQNLKKAIDELGDDMPVYGPVTATESGLMIPQDKLKLDSLEEYQLATGTIDGLMSTDDKKKLNRITANQAIDLDQFMADFLALKQTVEDMTAAE